jgi:hypothetical protein
MSATTAILTVDKLLEEGRALTDVVMRSGLIFAISSPARKPHQFSSRMSG